MRAEKLLEIPVFKKIRYKGLLVRIDLASRITKDESTDILASILDESELPLTPVKRSDESETKPTSLQNDPDLPSSESIIFKIDDSKTLYLSFRKDVEEGEITRYIRGVYDSAFMVKCLSVSAINFADIMHLFDLTYDGNHHELLAETYYNGSLFDNVFPASNLSSINVGVGSVVDHTKNRSVALIFKGATSAKEIRTQSFDNDEIDIGIGYVQVENVSRKEIGGFLVELLYDAREYVVSKLMNKLIVPLEQKAVQLESGK